MDRWKVYKKCDEYRVRSPKNVADLIEIKSIAENGIFEAVSYTHLTLPTTSRV